MAPIEPGRGLQHELVVDGAVARRVGRWLNPDRRGTADFIEARLHRDYDPDICPVTGDECP